ncbi:ATP-binding protein [Sedimentisphaera salicampi]|uniref:histidine kinase n=1 Tax=Sedimentisphaera salicampi TaxID=1941349 RepID=A0A1W6LLK5_9BACT|nr:ATP-binding protein [Sedimentisphaera salicampi]ARN56647.1 Sensor histidine kinase YycG [Sedimentisphaera salicampi]
MKKKSIFWRFFRTVLAVVFLSLLFCFISLEKSVSQVSAEFSKKNLSNAASLAEKVLQSAVENLDYEKMESICITLGNKTDLRFTIINRQGNVLADSSTTPSGLKNYSDNPHFIQAIENRKQKEEIYTPENEEPMCIYTAVETSNNESFILKCCRRQSLSSQYSAIIASAMLKISGVSLLIAAISSAFLANVTIRPLIKMRKGVIDFAEGKLDKKLEIPETHEMGSLAKSLNNMARELDKKIAQITEQQASQEAILTSMVEAVVALSNKKDIIMANKAAVELFGLQEGYIGNYYANLIRNTDFQTAIENTTKEGSSKREIVLMRNNNEFILHLQGTVLKNPSGETIGSLYVLNDVTEIKRLEAIRKDFVANVSHELKTPVTSIKGFAEMLEDGGISSPEDQAKFIGIIARQTQRLEAIIEDLLSISKLEQKGDQLRVDIEPADIRDIVISAMQLCEKRASQKNISIELTSSGDIHIPVNPNLLEQAVMNLVDNAVKYSSENTEVHITIVQDSDETRIAVQDHGCGIPKSEQERLFERFYRVDKGRSRELGGTGLGLSIVKHIVSTVHGGRITLESTLNKGSTFTIHLPKNSKNT